MSVFYELADEIAEHLGTIQVFAGETIVVDRQKDIGSELRKVLAKQTGSLVVVTWIGATNSDQSGDAPCDASRFTVTVFSKPIIRKGETTADELIEAAINALHDHRPNGRFDSRLIVTGIDPVPADDFLAFRINIKAPYEI